VTTGVEAGTTRYASPERRWRAGLTVVAAACLGWYLSSRLASLAGIVAGSALGAGSLCLAAPIIRSHLAVNGGGLTDRRAFRVVRLSWSEIAEFRVDRPGGLWGGFCVVATRHDGSAVDLLSTRAYSRIPSARHLDEVYRICWSLEEAAASRRHDDR